MQYILKNFSTRKVDQYQVVKCAQRFLGCAYSSMINWLQPHIVPGRTDRISQRCESSIRGCRRHWSGDQRGVKSRKWIADDRYKDKPARNWPTSGHGEVWWLTRERSRGRTTTLGQLAALCEWVERNCSEFHGNELNVAIGDSGDTLLYRYNDC